MRSVNSTYYAYNHLGLPEQQTVGGKSLGPKYDKDGNVVSDTDLQNGYVTDYTLNMFGQVVETDQPNNTVGMGGLRQDDLRRRRGGAGDDGKLQRRRRGGGRDGSVGQPEVRGATTSSATRSVSSLPDPANGDQDSDSPTTYDTYDLDGELVATTTPPASGSGAGDTTSYSFDSFGDEVSQSLPVSASGAEDGPTTMFTFDADGNTLSLTDPEGNTTSWTYASGGQMATQSEAVALGYAWDGTTRSIDTTTANYSDQYDLAGNLAESVDADDQAIVFSYDAMNDETGETWYPTAADATTETDSDGSESFSYDVLGNTATASNSAASYKYTYDVVGDAINTQAELAGVTIDGS